MADPFGRLFFPLTSFKIARVFSTGESFLDVVIKKSWGKYSSTFSKAGKPVKLSLEKIEPHDFTQALLQCYFFRQPQKEYGGPRQLLARLGGFHEKEPLEMQYRDQKYLITLKVKQNSLPLELQLFYSAAVGQLVVRAGRGKA